MIVHSEHAIYWISVCSLYKIIMYYTHSYSSLFSLIILSILFPFHLSVHSLVSRIIFTIHPVLCRRLCWSHVYILIHLLLLSSLQILCCLLHGLLWMAHLEGTLLWFICRFQQCPRRLTTRCYLNNQMLLLGSKCRETLSSKMFS